MKKVILGALMLLAISTATMAQTSTGTETAKKGQAMKHHAKKHHHKAHQAKTQAGATQK